MIYIFYGVKKTSALWVLQGHVVEKTYILCVFINLVKKDLLMYDFYTVMLWRIILPVLDVAFRPIILWVYIVWSFVLWAAQLVSNRSVSYEQL